MTDSPEQSRREHDGVDPNRSEPGEKRWPRRVFGSGDEPDPRFSLANERTFLAWIRTALALLATGVALDAFVTTFDHGIRRVVAIAIVAAGVLVAGGAFSRWARAEMSLRQGRPMATGGTIVLLGYLLAAAGVAVAIIIAVRR